MFSSSRASNCGLLRLVLKGIPRFLSSCLTSSFNISFLKRHEIFHALQAQDARVRVLDFRRLELEK